MSSPPERTQRRFTVRRPDPTAPPVAPTELRAPILRTQLRTSPLPGSTADAAPRRRLFGGASRARLLGPFRRAWGRWSQLGRPYAAPVRQVLDWVSPLGWGVLVACLSCWFVGRRLGWLEFSYAAVVLLLLLLLSGLLMLGRTQLSVDIRVEPPRVVAGDPAAMQVVVTNVGRRALMPLPLDIPAVEQRYRFALPLLRSGEEFERVVSLPTRRRGCFLIGPATTRRGDPFGLVARELEWTQAEEFYVHPETVALDAIGSGLLKDLEGRSSNDVSMSDLAFHTLREYAPGDDRRHIHWLSSAKRSSAAGSAEFMVRQFLDTRRSHVGIALDCTASSWLDEDAFETGVSAAASVALRAMRDELDLTQVAGHLVATRPQRHTALDIHARAVFDGTPLRTSASLLAKRAPNVSSVLLVTGPLSSNEDLLRAKSSFSPDVNVLAVRVELRRPITMRRSAGMTVITIGHLGDLRLALQGRFSA